jgi:hypothetical protein
MYFCSHLILLALTNISPQAGTRAPHWRHPHDDSEKSPIPAWPIPKREYRQHETSSSISGTFKLYDLLDLETTSGSVNINVETQAGDKPAVVRVRTQSGSVRINMGQTRWPWPSKPTDGNNRTFETSIATQSGSVSGSVLAGNGGLTTIETASGSIRLNFDVLAEGSNNATSRIETISQSGSQTISVAAASSGDLSTLSALHLMRGSGSASISYPTSWIGKLHMQCMGSGSLRASGRGLQFAQDGNREKYAWRGHGDLKDVEIVSQASGSVNFRC